MKDLSHRKAPQTSAHGDRPAYPPTILLRKSNSSQAALGPQTHQMFLEKAYNAGGPRPWDSVLALSIMALHLKRSRG